MPFASCFKRPLLAAAAALALTATGAAAADLSVTITDVRSADATIRIALYADAKSFRHEAEARQVLVVPAAVGTVSVTFPDVAPGRYAALAYHDENGNGKLDLILGMIPDEGWGLSNDPTVIGPPGFEPSAFTVAEEGTSITVPLHY